MPGIWALRRAATFALTLALSGCAATYIAPNAQPFGQGHAAPRACTDMSLRLAKARWWACLGDAALSGLIEGAPALKRSPASAQAILSATIAQRYIALRAQQTALVLLAEREELDEETVPIAGQDEAAIAARLAETRADQARTRAEIASLHEGLAVLTGSARDKIAGLPGGPIPLPPPAPLTGDPAASVARRPDIRLAAGRLAAIRGPGAARMAALADYRAAMLAAQQDAQSALMRYAAARIAAADAQAQAISARATAALQAQRARDGTLPSSDALAANRRALDALQVEEQYRAAMTQAYVALLESSGRW